jgi:hypothetical protein
MNRRIFMKNAAVAGAAASILPSTVLMEGCSFNVTSAINSVLDSLAAILKLADSSSTWVSSLDSAIAALKQAEASWKTGSDSSIVVDALDTVEAVLAVIPTTATYSALVDIAVAAIETIMSSFGLTVQLTTTAQVTNRQKVVNSPHYKAVKLTGPTFLHPTWPGAYKAQWNSECVKLDLAAAKI